MRVISGISKGFRLYSPVGTDIRPTSDMNKETIFNILAPYVQGSVVLDLFAGSGGLGIEALSRGADFVAFVDSAKKSIEIIEKNLDHTNFKDKNKAKVYFSDYKNALMTLANENKYKFDLIFLDPPYQKNLIQTALDLVLKYELLAEDGLVVVEQSSKEETEFEGYSVYKFRKHSTTTILFLKKEN